MAIVLALCTCVAWGASDYVAGRNGPALAATTIAFASHAVGLLLLTAAAHLSGAPLALDEIALGAGVGGALTAVGLLALYRALALGPMTVIAPISGTAVVVPVIAASAAGDPLSRWQWVGLAGAVAGVALASATHGRATAGRGLAGPALAVLSAFALGGGLVGIDDARGGEPLWTATLVHASALLVIAAVMLATRAPLRIPARKASAVVTIGVLGAAGHVCFAWATTAGSLASVAVVASLYPVTTLVAARLLDHERVSRRQCAGVALALGAIALVSSGQG